jgi:hypothetical protein
LYIEGQEPAQLSMTKEINQVILRCSQYIFYCTQQHFLPKQ